jgi:hypothetical protein
MTDALALAASGSAWPLPLQAVTIPPLPTLDPALPDLWVALPTGEQATLPGLVWPEMAAAQPRRPGGRQPKPILDMVEINIRTADRLLAEFQHPLPPASRRRFGRIAYALRAFGAPVAVCVSASAPNPSVAQDHGLHRLNTVELARIGRRDRAATLAALRLWREYLAPLFAERYAASGWAQHRLRAAITYSLPGTPASAPAGHGIYRRDGWVRLRRRKLTQPGPSAGWSQPSAAAPLADGIAGLWVWWYEPPTKPERGTNSSTKATRADPPRGLR